MSGNPGDCECGHGHGFTREPLTVASTCHRGGCDCRGFRPLRRCEYCAHVIVTGSDCALGVCAERRAQASMELAETYRAMLREKEAECDRAESELEAAYDRLLKISAGYNHWANGTNHASKTCQDALLRIGAALRQPWTDGLPAEGRSQHARIRQRANRGG